MHELTGSQERIDALLKVLENSKARQRTLEIAHKAAAKREACCLHLAFVLLGLKAELGLSFDDLAIELGRAIDPSALYKIAYRQQGVRLRTYKILTQRINELRQTSGLDPIKFDDWKEYR